MKLFFPFLIFYFNGAKNVGTSFTSMDISSPFYLFFPYENERPYFLFGLSNSGNVNDFIFTGGVNPDTLFSLKLLYALNSERKEDIALLGGFGKRNTLLFLGGKISSTDSSSTGFVFFTGIQKMFYYMGTLNKAIFAGGGISSIQENPFLTFSYSIKFIPLKNITPLFNYRFDIKEKFNYNFALSSEFILYKNYNFFVGFMKEKFISPYFSFGFGYITSRFEESDFGIHYGFLSNGDEKIHSVSLSLFLGDNLKFEKAKIKREKELKELAERERMVSERMREIEEKEKEFGEREKRLLEEKERLKKEKEEIEKMREEAYETLKKIEGIKIEERKEYIKITAEEKAIHFEIGGTGLNIRGIKTLKAIANFIKTYPGYRVRIEGHTDNIPIGPLLKDKYKDNMELSEARAKVVMEYFVEIEGLPKEMFTYRGYGETKPVASNATEEGRAKNRRVEIYIEKEE